MPRAIPIAQSSFLHAAPRVQWNSEPRRRSRSWSVPSAHISVIMSGGAHAYPMKRITFGWRSRDMRCTSFANACSVSSSYMLGRGVLTATRMPRYSPECTSPDEPPPTTVSSEISATFTRHSSPARTRLAGSRFAACAMHARCAGVSLPTSRVATSLSASAFLFADGASTTATYSAQPSASYRAPALDRQEA